MGWALKGEQKLTIWEAGRLLYRRHNSRDNLGV